MFVFSSRLMTEKRFISENINGKTTFRCLPIDCYSHTGPIILSLKLCGVQTES